MTEDVGAGVKFKNGDRVRIKDDPREFVVLIELGGKVWCKFPDGKSDVFKKTDLIRV